MPGMHTHTACLHPRCCRHSDRIMALLQRHSMHCVSGMHCTALRRFDGSLGIIVGLAATKGLLLKRLKQLKQTDKAQLEGCKDVSG